MSEIRYGLYHVHSKTGEIIPFACDTSHNLSKMDAETKVLDLNIGKGRGTACRNDWEIKFLPDQPVHLVVP